jgi:hypothetical protein
LQSHRHFADDGIPGFHSNINTNLDPTDLTDADTFEELAHNFDLFLALVCDQANLDQLLDLPPGPEEPLAANQTEADNLETMSTVVIDQFPHSSAGAPIPGMGCAQESYQDMHADSVWAPFNSQCDWLFAQWAKIHGPTSLAVTQLLEIPQVRVRPAI